MVTAAIDIKRCLLLGRKAMTNLDSRLKSKDVTLPTKVRPVKAMAFPVEDTEWSEAQAHHHVGDMEIVPIKLPRYDERNATIIGKLPDCISSHTVFDLERQRIDSLIEIIHTTLNR